MDQEDQKQRIIEGLKKILELSFQHCEDNGPNEREFIEINQLAHEVLLRVTNLCV